MSKKGSFLLLFFLLSLLHSYEGHWARNLTQSTISFCHMVQCLYSATVFRDHFHWILSWQRWQSIFHRHWAVLREKWRNVTRMCECPGHDRGALKGAVCTTQLQSDHQLQPFNLPSVSLPLNDEISVRFLSYNFNCASVICLQDKSEWVMRSVKAPIPLLLYAVNSVQVISVYLIY